MLQPWRFRGLFHGIIVQWKRSHKLSGVPWCCWNSDIVLDETCITPSFLRGSTLWIQCCLQKNVTGFTNSGDCQALDTLVAVTPVEVSAEGIIPSPLFSDMGRFSRKRPSSVSHRIMASVVELSNYYTGSFEPAENINFEPCNQPESDERTCRIYGPYSSLIQNILQGQGLSHQNQQESFYVLV